MARNKKAIEVESFSHDEARRRNIPTAELQSLYEREQGTGPVTVSYPRATPLAPGERRERNSDLDPQLVWRGKDEQDWSDLVVHAPPLYIQEKVHPKVIIKDLKRQSARRREQEAEAPDLFADFNGLPDAEAKLEFYQHDQNWSNRMILGDSLQVMASLAEREGLRGQVQCIYIDPPYGIRFNSNWQVSTRSRDVKDGKADQISREPEQIKAFRDTWKDGIHSYLTYLRDRLMVARDLLHASGSIFVQIGDENVHRVRGLMDEVFGEENFISQISTKTSGGSTGEYMPNVVDFILWYSKDRDRLKYRSLARGKQVGADGAEKYNRVKHADLSVRSLTADERANGTSISPDARVYRQDNMTSQSVGREKGEGAASWFPVRINGIEVRPNLRVRWKTNQQGMDRLLKAERVELTGNSISYVRFLDDFSAIPLSNTWDDLGGIQSRADPKVYVVQTPTTVVQRCMLMTTDPGDLVLDPTCGSGTTAYVTEQWGRRLITIDTSRVSLALARARIMGARYHYYLLADSEDGRRKEAEITGKVPADGPTYHDIRQGFVYERVPHVTLKSIVNNAEIDVIWEKCQPAVEAARAALNLALVGHAEPFPVTTGGRAGQSIDFTDSGVTALPSGENAPANGFMEWEIPREPETPWPAHQAALHAEASVWSSDASPKTRGAAHDALAALNAARAESWDFDSLPARPVTPWPEEAASALNTFWEARIALQTEIDDAIARAADVELLYDKPYEDRSKVRVAGPFTVESLSPHRVIPGDEHEAGDEIEAVEGARRRGTKLPYERAGETDFAEVVLEHLRTAGVQQAHKEDRITFTSLAPWPGEYVGAEGRYMEGERERRAAIFIGPEFGTVGRPDLIAAAREAAEAGFEVLIACGFAYDAHASEFSRLGPLPVLRARMNPDLHMADELKNTGAGNLFVVFGEPDVEVRRLEGDRIEVEIKGVDVFDPQTGDVRSGGTDDIAAWFIDTDYDEESFFVRHAYFLGAHDPYKALKTTLKAEIDEEAWATLYRATSRPFPRPSTGRFAVKVINHFGDEVMKVFGV